MAFAPSLCRLTIPSLLAVRPSLIPSTKAARCFSYAVPNFSSTASTLAANTPSQSSRNAPSGPLSAKKGQFLSSSSTSRLLTSATSRKPAIGQQRRRYTTMASTDIKPIQLYSLATPNGQKIGIFLEESGIPYEAHLIDIGKGDQFSPEFVKINPNSKIPAIVDPNGPNGEEIRIFESGAILLYLAEKYNSPLYPKDDLAKKAETLGWLFWQVGGLGPTLGQVGHFWRFAKEDVPYAKERYLTEAKRLLTVLDKALDGKEYLTGDYSIADISAVTWANGVNNFDNKIVSLTEYPNVKAWVERIFARPQVQKGVKVCAK